jgi:CO/xanthine dehydrogenase FAD-binding subunit
MTGPGRLPAEHGPLLFALYLQSTSLRGQHREGIMRDFEYEAPTTLAEALEVLRKSNGAAKALAGGTDLIDHVRTGRLTPDVLVDVKKIDELNVLELSDSGLRVGAAVPCYRIYGCPEISQQYAALTDSARIIGGIQIQSRASVGGNLCNSGPAADSIPSLIALGGVAVIAGPNGQREVAVEEFCTGPGRNVLQPGELLVEIKLPARAANSGSHYRVVGVGASVELDESGQNFVSARISLGAVGPTPLFAQAASDALAGQPVNDESIAKAAAAAKEVATPITDMRGTAEFRTHLVGVLAERVVNAAVSRARGEAICFKPGH